MHQPFWAAYAYGVPVPEWEKALVRGAQTDGGRGLSHQRGPPCLARPVGVYQHRGAARGRGVISEEPTDCVESVAGDVARRPRSEDRGPTGLRDGQRRLPPAVER